MDDLKDVHLANKDNVIKARYFDAETKSSEDDDFLLDAIKILESIRKMYENDLNKTSLK